MIYQTHYKLFLADRWENLPINTQFNSQCHIEEKSLFEKRVTQSQFSSIPTKQKRKTEFSV